MSARRVENKQICRARSNREGHQNRIRKMIAETAVRVDFSVLAFSAGGWHGHNDTPLPSWLAFIIFPLGFAVIVILIWFKTRK